MSNEDGVDSDDDGSDGLVTMGGGEGEEGEGGTGVEGTATGGLEADTLVQRGVGRGQEVGGCAGEGEEGVECTGVEDTATGGHGADMLVHGCREEVGECAGEGNEGAGSTGVEGTATGRLSPLGADMPVQRGVGCGREVGGRAGGCNGPLDLTFFGKGTCWRGPGVRGRLY